MSNRLRIRGISTVEVLLGVSIFALVVVFTMFSVSLFIDGADDAHQQVQALYLAEEGYEIVRYIRDEDWNTIDALATDTTHYLDVASTTVAVTATPETIGGSYNRSFVLREVYRDSDDDIVASSTVGASVDTGSRYVDVYVSWGTEQVVLEGLLTNIFDI